MNSEFFSNFISDFFENMENDIESILKKEKVKKLSVKKLNVEVIDYLNGSQNPVLDTIKANDESLEFYVNNPNSTPYEIEDIFHPFSLAGFTDTLIGEEKYTVILKDFYQDTESSLINHFKENNLIDLEILDQGHEILSLSTIDGKFSLVEGVVKNIYIKEDRVFLTIRDEHGNDYISHLIECQASDIATILNSIFNS